MADRKITYTLTLDVDKNNARAAKEFADQIERLQKMQSRAFSENGGSRGGGGARGTSAYARGEAAGAQRLREETREREAMIRLRWREVQEERRALADRVRANVEASRRIRDAAIEASREARKAQAATFSVAHKSGLIDRGGGGGGRNLPAGNELAADFNAWRNANAERERGEARAAAATSRAYKETRQAAGAAAEAVMMYARAAAYAIAADEETAEKLAKVIVKFESFSAVVQGTSKAIEAVKKAQGAIGGMNAAGGGFSAGGLAGRASSAIGGMGAGGAFGFAALGAAVLAGVGVLVQAINDGESKINEAAMRMRRQLSNDPNSAVNLGYLSQQARFGNEIAGAKLAEALAFRDQYNTQQSALHGQDLSNMRVAFETSGHGRSRLEAARMFERNASVYQREFEGRLAQANGSNGLGASGDRIRAMEGMAEAMRARLEGIRQVGDAELEIKRTQSDAARDAINSLKQRKALLEDELRTAREARMSAAELFGSKMPAEQQSILMAARKLKAGGQLSRGEEDILDPFFSDQVSASRRARAHSTAGYNELIDPRFQNAEFKAQARVNNINNKIEVKNDFKIQIDKEISDAVQDINKKLRTVADQLVDITTRLNELSTDEQLRKAQEALRTGTRG
jgi:heme exporter protein D